MEPMAVPSCYFILHQYLLIMFFGGNFPFGFEQDHHEEEDDGEEQEQQSFYDLLGCSPDAPTQEINHKYEALVAKHGPEGEEADEQLLEQIKEAYDVLSDPQKRKLYDMTQQSGGHGGIFNMMFGGQQKPGKKNDQKPKMQPTKRVLEVSLEKIFSGGVVELHHQRARLCESCAGKGGENIKKCPICKGQGGVVQLVQMGPGMYSQAEKQCQNCKGLGELFDEGIKCKDCDGRKICKKEVDLPVSVPIGIPAGQIITLEGQGNEVPEASAGDLLLIVQEIPHAHFSRKGADLFYKKTISLAEALVGFSFKLAHLDGKQYTVYSRAGEVVGDHSKKIVRGLGMPFFKNQELRGNLVIEFKVAMPKRGDLTPKQIQILTKTLPGQMNARPSDANYEMLEDFDKEHLNSSEQGGKKKEDDEEEGEEGIGCQPQ